MLKGIVSFGFIALLMVAPHWARASAFEPCSDADKFKELQGSLCARAESPLNPSAGKQGATVELFIRKFPAVDERRRPGEVWLVAGGPGETGAAFYPALSTLRRAFPDYDLIIPDHRGTGYSIKLCPDQESLESADGIGLAGEEWGPCIASMYANPARTQAFTITNAAQDLSGLIREYRGTGPVYLYGVSYGTQLALRMMQVAPVELDGLILDGLVPPEGALDWEISHRTRIVDEVGRAFLTLAQSNAVSRLVAHAATHPGWIDQVPGKDIRQFMGTLLNFPALRSRIPALADELIRDDTTLLTRTIADLREMGHTLAPFPQSTPSLPLVMLITGSENNSRRAMTLTEVSKEAENALFTSALPKLLVAPPVPLYDRDASFGQLPLHLPRTLVVQGTLDPNTPIEGARAHIKALSALGDIHLTTVVGGAHALMLFAPDCFAQAASAFVSHSVVPEVCQSMN